MDTKWLLSGNSRIRYTIRTVESQGEWDIDSNAESGDGFSDILVKTSDGETGIVIEVKDPDGGGLDAG